MSIDFGSPCYLHLQDSTRRVLDFFIIRNGGNCLPIDTGSYVIPEDLSLLLTLTTAEYFCSVMHP